MNFMCIVRKRKNKPVLYKKIIIFQNLLHVVFYIKSINSENYFATKLPLFGWFSLTQNFVTS
jgi:hypothetical protein